MKYLATADSLVTDGLITWEIEADSFDDAWTIGFNLMRENKHADQESLMVRPIEEDKQGIEDKQAICVKLLEALQLTRNLHDLLYLEYFPDKEHVVAHFPGGNKTVIVYMDSGTAMILDIIKGIV